MGKKTKKKQPNREVGQKRMNNLVETTKMHKETERKKKRKEG